MRRTIARAIRTPSRLPTLSERQKIAQDTIDRSSAIVAEHTAEGATLDSQFIRDQLDPLPGLTSEQESLPRVTVDVQNMDSFEAARELLKRYPDAKGKVTVLNLASDIYPAGSWVETLSMTQEEALCYSSTLYATLKEEYYPWPNTGQGSIAGIFSPGVVVFKDTLSKLCADLPKEQRMVVSVITVAAPRWPKLSADRTTFRDPSVLEDLRGKIRLVYRMALHNGQEYIVPGAMGCGAYGCPAKIVAQEMKDVLLEPEFVGRFKGILFAVYSAGDVGPAAENFNIFNSTLNGTVV
ncbi:hypothetical protein AX16_003494 [Volvariella volvacea WC 439]|nr:hypothetical protein AX16_003494 [Volvariella volvacea WC 439]